LKSDAERDVTLRAKGAIVLVRALVATNVCLKPKIANQGGVKVKEYENPSQRTTRRTAKKVNVESPGIVVREFGVWGTVLYWAYYCILGKLKALKFEQLEQRSGGALRWRQAVMMA
jgi:hypothetical protein